MKAIKGIYQAGKLVLEEDVSIQTPLHVIVTFLDEIPESKHKRIDISKFHFHKSRALSKECHTSLSQEVINERRDL